MAELSDEARALIKDSIRIVKEDRIYAKLHSLHPDKAPDPPAPKAGDPGTPSGAGNPGAPVPPPAAPPKEPPAKKGLWSVGSTD
jgi:hypothetical protein